MSISTLLRESSRTEHKEAESSKFIVELMRGQLNLEAYTRYLVNLGWLYKALEQMVATGEPFPTSEPIWDSRLSRLQSISNDIEALGVVDWQNTTVPSSAMKSYIAHLESLQGKADPRLVAHHYTRYLGDLSGGQAIASLVARNYQATPDQLTFYKFDEIDDLVRFKESYRTNLDSLELSNDQVVELVSEVRLAFEFNQKVFEDLAR